MLTHRTSNEIYITHCIYYTMLEMVAAVSVVPLCIGGEGTRHWKGHPRQVCAVVVVISLSAAACWERSRVEVMVACGAG